MAKKPSRNLSTPTNRLRSSHLRSNSNHPNPGPDPDPNPNSVYRTPSSARAVFTPAKTLEFISLHDWWLCKAPGKGLCVAGVEGLRARMFLSGRISKCHDTTTLETVDGIMVAINGMINLDRTQQNGFSLEVGNLFLLGFPYDWEAYGEEPANSSAQTEKPHSAEFVNDADKAHFSVTLDDIPVCRIRDFLMLPLEGSEDCSKRKILDDILRSLESCDSKSNQDLGQSPKKDEYSCNPKYSGDQETRVIHLNDPQDCTKRKTWVDGQTSSGRFDMEPKPRLDKSVRQNGNLINVKNSDEQETPIFPPRDLEDSSKLKSLVDVHPRSSDKDLSKANPNFGLLGTEDGCETDLNSNVQEILIKNPITESQPSSKSKTTATPILCRGVRTRRMTFLTDLMDQQDGVSLSKACPGTKHDNRSRSRGTSRKKTLKKNICSAVEDGNNVQGVVTRSASRRNMQR